MQIQPSMISNPFFATALLFTLREEGGFVDNPADHGGPTNAGVTQVTYDTWRKAKGLPAQSIRALEGHEAADIYEQMYWVPGHCGEMSPKLSICHFDWTVQHGVHGATETLQDVLAIKVDGIFGSKTREALELMPQDDLIAEYIQQVREWFERNVKADPTQQVFLAGRMARQDRLAKYLGMQS